MDRLFIIIYDWFAGHRKILYSLMAALVILLGFFAFQVDFNENISSFFGEDEEASAVFDNIRIKDRIVIMVSGDNPENMIEAGEAFADSLDILVEKGLLSSVTRGADDSTVGGSVDFMYEYLPLFIEDSDYARIDSCLTDEAIEDAVRQTFTLVTSPSGIVLKDIVMRDPLSIGTHLMRRFERFSGDMEYEMYAGHIFTEDMAVMLMFADPAFSMGSTGNNAGLVSALEDMAAAVSENSGVRVNCIGGPIVAVYNARQIKHDTGVTLSMALLLIIAVIVLSFRNRRTVPLIILPPVFGALFALAMIYFIQGYVSAIAVGAGSVVLGISLSYSIHVVSHSNHTHDPRQIIRDLAYPLTIGSFTTIGAFAALTFTNSPLLHDMGLFAVFALVGTALFCLVFLPHFIKNSESSGERPLLKIIEKANAVHYEDRKWLITIIAVLTVVSLFFYQDVSFDDDMSNINFMPEHIIEAEEKLSQYTIGSSGEVLIACSSADIGDASDAYLRLDSLVLALQEDGRLTDYVSVKDFVLSPDLQRERIGKWNAFWEGRREKVMDSVENAAVRCGFRKNAFSGFSDILYKDYRICEYSEDVISQVPALSDWINPMEDGTTLLLSRIRIDDAQKEEVYAMMNQIGGISVIDRAWFSSKMVSDTSEDFDFIVLISSLIVFLALLLSYGRVELALLSFLPMCISWVIILGFMAVMGIEFNIVNIILATFIFGIGDDFSIFIMDGLMQEYRGGRKALESHKTAIFFSAFTTIVGMGAMIFAEHPALKSIAVVSVLGLAVVVLVSYTVQPFLFRLFISGPASKGGFPYTFPAVLNTVYAFAYFFTGCVIARIYRILLYVLPLDRKRKKESFHHLLYWITRIFMNTMFTVKTKRLNPYGETFEKPAVIIANHQSFVDILLMLSTHPKIIMLTNDWVWNSPFFGKIVRYADYYHTADGYESLVGRLKERVDEGYSILVFPEGTRSADCSILRFHKGAFYLAKELHLDIVPVAIYGAGQFCSKKQGFYIKHGDAVTRILKRVPYGDVSFGETYQEQAKMYRRFFREQYECLCNEFGKVNNPYFRDALVKNYIYKGPVIEWYIRVKSRIDGWYALWDTLIPRDAVITDVGCGYGQMSFMLSLLGPSRKVHGIDYDRDKIDLAANSFLSRRGNISFECADMLTCVMPQSDVFLFNDSLHYVDAKSQCKVMENCLSMLNPGGMMVVRDGDSSDERHGRIVDTEKWSVKILNFNRSENQLTWVSKSWMQDFAERNNLELKMRKCDSDTSETLYIFKKRD